MRKTTINVATPAGNVDTLGVPLGAHFAWTHIPGGPVTGNPTTVTHRPTGQAILHSITNVAAARRIVEACEALPVDWAQTDAEVLVNAVAAAVGDVAAWRAMIAEAALPPRPAKVPRLAELLKSNPWKGSTVTEEPHEVGEREGDCKIIGCKARHAVGYGVGSRKKIEAQRRHYETVPCYRIAHPSGAIAWVRKDA